MWFVCGPCSERAEGGRQPAWPRAWFRPAGAADSVSSGGSGRAPEASVYRDRGDRIKAAQRPVAAGRSSCLLPSCARSLDRRRSCLGVPGRQYPGSRPRLRGMAVELHHELPAVGVPELNGHSPRASRPAQAKGSPPCDAVRRSPSPDGRRADADVTSSDGATAASTSDPQGS